MNTLFERVVPSPLGPLTLFANARALVGVFFASHRPAHRLRGQEAASHDVLAEAEISLDRYFRGLDARFVLPTAARGTPFQHDVWSALGDIPLGETWSYEALAKHVGRPNAARAVGMANARNPLSIVVPCHRVVAKHGALAGYAGGVEAKRWLLEHERRIVAGQNGPNGVKVTKIQLPAW